MPVAQVAQSATRFSALLGSVAVWFFGTFSSLYFLAWSIASPNGAEETTALSPAAIGVVTVIAAADLLLCLAAVRPAGTAVVRVAAIAVAVLAVVGILVREPATSEVLSFLVPTLTYAVVLPVALVGRQDLRAATKSMATLTVAFVLAYVGQQVNDSGLWIAFADLAGALATGVLAALYLVAEAARQRAARRAAEPLHAPSSSGGSGP